MAQPSLSASLGGLPMPLSAPMSRCRRCRQVAAGQGLSLRPSAAAHFHSLSFNASRSVFKSNSSALKKKSSLKFL